MEELLRINKLSTSFKTMRGMVKAIEGVSFSIKKNEIVGVVGESGCGKSVTSQSIMRLYDEKDFVKYTGEILFEDKGNLFDLPEKEMQSIRGNEIAMIFQDALTSLNPVMKVGKQIEEAILIHEKISKEEAKKRSIEILDRTGIPDPEKRYGQYPHELSGGMRQRAMIALALSCRPKLLIADEPTTALDVTIQAQIMDLIVDLNKELGMGIMLITHDLGVVAQVCQRVLVMYLGQVVEQASVEELFEKPLHPYTEGLLKSIPTADSDPTKPLYMIKGTVPPLSEAGEGCRFCGRCQFATEKCKKQMPHLVEVMPNRKVRCHKIQAEYGKEGAVEA